MKIFHLTLIFVFFILNANSQNTSSNDAKTIKDKKIIVALKEYPKKTSEEGNALIDSANASFKFAMEKYWTFSEIHDYMPISEAQDFIKKNNGYCYIAIDVGVVKSTSNSRGVTYLTYGEKLSIYAGKTALISTYLPYFEGYLTKTAAAFTTIHTNKLLDLMYTEKYKSWMDWWSHLNDFGPEIINKTLLIPKEFISPKLSEDDVKLLYPFDHEICDLEKIDRAVLNKDPKYAVVFFVVWPGGRGYTNKLFIYNAEDGNLFDIVGGASFNLNLGIISIGGGQNKKYLINEKEIKQMAKIAQ